MTTVDLNHRLYDAPFRPFRIHLSHGTTIPVTRSGMALVGSTSVILPTEVGRDADGHPLVKRWRTVVLAHILRCSQIDEPVRGRRRRERP